MILPIFQPTPKPRGLSIACAELAAILPIFLVTAAQDVERDRSRVGRMDSTMRGGD